MVGLSVLLALIIYINLGLLKKYTPKGLWGIESKNKTEHRKKHSKPDKPEMFAKYFNAITTRIGKNKSAYKMNYKMAELKKAVHRFKGTKETLNWVLRGPANVGGRTRAVIVDPDDATHLTWFAGAVAGGIWKTTDGGENWTYLSETFSNLGISAMAMAKSNTQVIYAGTGESTPAAGASCRGNGIWKSTDKGSTWTQLSSTSTDEDFAYINRIIVDPTNADIVIVASENGIYKSSTGGTSWTEVYSSNTGVEDIVPDPTTFDIIFAGENSIGVLRSIDAGENWTISSDGLAQGNRYEVDVSPVDNNYVFTSVNFSSTESHIYMSDDNGLSWKKFDDSQAFLGTQGTYDNIIAAHPYNANEAYVSGVDVWNVKFNGDETTSEPTILAAYTVNTTFLSFVNFGGDYLGGGMSTEDADATAESVSVEIRFGIGLSQKAHRFTVPDESTSGVPANNYTYVDYVEVPFQVWDVTNNKQLMVSFRDQEKDGKYNLYERNSDDYGELGREYIFVNSIAYDETNADFNIAKIGGHLNKCLYMFWPTLTPRETWSPEALPTSKIIIKYGTQTLKAGEKTSIAAFAGPNAYDQAAGFGNTSIPGLHPDHHSLDLIPTGDGNFLWIEGNDGGMAVSTDNGATFNQKPNNYITTQFYGVAKNPVANEYIGGTQDNGTWQTVADEDASSTSNYLFRIGGDGFECLWHTKDPNLILGSVYNNSIRRSSSKGVYWGNVTGIVPDDGPFISRLSASKENPDLVFAVGGRGVYRSTNFGSSWFMKNITTNWSVDNTVTSSHNVEVSLANGNIVWAGAAMATDFGLQIQVSTDEGNTFTATNDYSLVDMNGYVSGISTHPTEDSTAYVLFSFSDAPKVLRTKNLGESWEDISGFGTGNESTNGFPDVITHCLIVMPHKTSTIWVGTNIGLFESTDNGVSWHIANNGLPPVSVYDMHISGNQVVVATHGRGIWTVDIPEIDNSPYISEFTHVEKYDLSIETNLKVTYDSVEVYINGVLDSTLQSPAEGETTIPVDVEADGLYMSYLIAYISDTPYKSNKIDLDFTYVPTGFEDLEKNDEFVSVYPNPADDYFKLNVDKKYSEYFLEIFNMKGQRIYSIKKENTGNNKFNVKSLKNGLYIINVSTGDERLSQRIQISH